VLHYEGMSGALRSLPHRLGALEPEVELEFLVPRPGPAQRDLASLGTVEELRYSALTFPDSVRRTRRHLADLRAEARRFRGHFAESRPDLVITTSTMLPGAVWAAGKEGIPTLVHASELLTPERLPSPARRLVAERLLRWTAQRATLVVACSKAVADQFPSEPTPVEVLHPPIADDYGTEDRHGARRRLGIDDDRPCVAAVGSITRGRGQDVLMRAFAMLKKELPDARCLIVGEPFDRERDHGYRARLDNLAEQLGIADAVEFVGPVEQVARVYAAADLVVNPARIPESFGRVACEALLAGRPVVSTRVGAVSEVLRDEETALLVPAEDPDGLAAAMLRCFAEPAFASTLAAAGRADVLRRFDPDSVAERFSLMVAEALARESQSPDELPAEPAAQARRPSKAAA
jgi:glycosyltransferase involved in cell wall biosynthesis